MKNKICEWCNRLKETFCRKIKKRHYLCLNYVHCIVEYKFNNIGGTISIVPENYTSQICPNCQSRHKPQNRVYKCPTCNFKDDKYIVCVKNIYKVSY